MLSWFSAGEEIQLRRKFWSGFVLTVLVAGTAAAAFEKLMAEATEVPVLNLAAECHLALGHPEKALPLIERSLALVPDQPALKVLEERAKKRIGQR